MGTFWSSSRPPPLPVPCFQPSHPWVPPRPPPGWLETSLCQPHVLELLDTLKTALEPMQRTQGQFLRTQLAQGATSTQRHLSKGQVQQLQRGSAAEAPAPGGAAALEPFETPLPASPHLESRLLKCKKSVVFLNAALNICKRRSGRKTGSGRRTWAKRGPSPCRP